MKKGRARSCDRVRDPLIRICPYGEVCISTPNEVCNKYICLLQIPQSQKDCAKILEIVNLIGL